MFKTLEIPRLGNFLALPPDTPLFPSKDNLTTPPPGLTRKCWSRPASVPPQQRGRGATPRARLPRARGGAKGCELSEQLGATGFGRGPHAYKRVEKLLDLPTSQRHRLWTPRVRSSPFGAQHTLQTTEGGGARPPYAALCPVVGIWQRARRPAPHRASVARGARAGAVDARAAARSFLPTGETVAGASRTRPQPFLPQSDPESLTDGFFLWNSRPLPPQAPRRRTPAFRSLALPARAPPRRRREQRRAVAQRSGGWGGAEPAREVRISCGRGVRWAGSSSLPVCVPAVLQRKPVFDIPLVLVSLAYEYNSMWLAYDPPPRLLRQPTWIVSPPESPLLQICRGNLDRPIPNCPLLIWKRGGEGDGTGSAYGPPIFLDLEMTPLNRPPLYGRRESGPLVDHIFVGVDLSPGMPPVSRTLAHPQVTAGWVDAKSITCYLSVIGLTRPSRHFWRRPR
eukprot:gene14387-biopygen12631